MSPAVAPANYLTLPEELTGPAPRELPPAVRCGPLAVQRQRGLWGSAVAATLCLALSAMPFVDTLAIYVLPFGYLDWIGYGLFGAALLQYAGGGEWKKALRYVQEGEVGLGRVTELVKCPTAVVNGQPTAYAFHASLEAINPASHAPATVQLKSRPFSADVKDRVTTRFRVGDDVPLVWLPNRYEETVQIYDFLELTPEACLVRAKSARPAPLWGLLALVVAIPGFIFAICWNVYALGRFEPIGFDYLTVGRAPMFLGGALALVAAAALWFAARKRRREIDERNIASAASGQAIEIPYDLGAGKKFVLAIVLTAGAFLMGGLTVLCWCFTANALLDRSPAEAELVEITNMVQVTHSFLFREYKLEYRLAGKDADNSLWTTPERLAEFDAPLGVAQVRSGWLGWPWVETIEPLEVP